MRLICPNCGAQYEVPVDVIPEGGRDVQCSNCAHTWFQRHPDDEPGPSEDAGAGDLPIDWQDDGDVRAEDVRAEDDRAEEAAEDAEPPEPSPEPSRHRRLREASADPAARARSIDPEVAEVLREERELERRRRAAESQALESQPDLGLQEPDEYERARREREARERMARMRGTEPEPPEDLDDAPVAPAQRGGTGRMAAAAAAAAAAGSRRELLPDVEEINQTLRAGTEPRTVDSAERYEAPDKRQAGGSGFRRGFFLVVLLVLLALALYVVAPRLTAEIPQIAPLLDAYVAQVDGLRLWLDGQLAELMSALDGMSSEAAPPTDGAGDN